MWKDSLRGDFNMRSAYSMAAGVDQLPEFNGGSIWKLHILPKIQFFLWKCTHNSIGVNDCLTARGVNTNPLCPLYRKEPKTIIHALQKLRRSGLYGTSWEQWVLTKTSFPQMLKIGQRLMGNWTQLTIKISLRGKSFSPLQCGIFGRIGISLSLRGNHRIQGQQRSSSTMLWSSSFVLA